MERPSIAQVTKYIFLSSDPQQADLALVFGTRHPEPLRVASGLYHQGIVPMVLVSGGRSRVADVIESELMTQRLVRLGVEPKRILTEGKSTNTLENVVFSKQLIEQTLGLERVRSIIIVVKGHHSRRAMMTMKKHFPSTVRVWPVTYTYDHDGFTRDNWHQSVRGREKVWGEWDRIQTYLAKGEIEEL